MICQSLFGYHLKYKNSAQVALSGLLFIALLFLFMLTINVKLVETSSRGGSCSDKRMLCSLQVVNTGSLNDYFSDSKYLQVNV